MSRELKGLADLVGYRCYTLGMGMFITLETICGGRELEKSLAGSFVD